MISGKLNVFRPQRLRLALALAAVTLYFASLKPALAGELVFQSCHARWSESELVIGNAHIERKWRIQNGLLVATSFRDLDAGIEWIGKPADRPAPMPAGKIINEPRAVSIAAHGGRLGPVEAESLVVEMTAAGLQTFHYQFQIFPEARGITVQFDASGGPAEANGTVQKEPVKVPTGFEQAAKSVKQLDEGDALEDLLVAPQHLRLTQVTFFDQTDIHNELVCEREWMFMNNESDILARGNIIFGEDVLTGAGLIFFKQAPLPDSRPIKRDWDVRVSAPSNRIRFAGQGYPFVVLAYSGGRTGRIQALQRYQRQIRVYDPQRDGMFLSNTWGDRSRDARINEEFMLKEITAGARLGVDVIQIDDGWQAGHSMNSARGTGVWHGFWAADSHFWDVDVQRFPGGLGKLVNSAKANGMKFGLWYAPDSSGNFANWQRDADRLLELYHKEGIEYFKLDSIHMPSTAAEGNLRHLFDRILKESNGQIVLDLDVTAGFRPGYFGDMNTGPIFVENRYTDFHRYWPHLTLRNLWMLSQYVDPLRLRMELLNNSRNANLYPNDPLAPFHYPPDCLFASVMVANPLGWFEASNLPGDYSAAVAGLAKIWKEERSRFYSGDMVPIGNPPDGVSWTGFASVGQNQTSGYLLLFRELNGSPQWSTDLSMFSNQVKRATVLAGNGSAEINRGQITINIPQPLQYLWVRVEAERGASQ